VRFDGRFSVGGVYINYDLGMAAEAMSRAYKDVIDISPEEILKSFSGWIIARLETSDGECIGGVIVRDGEGHIGIVKEFRGKWGGTETIRNLCKHFSVHKTSATATNHKANAMILASGFELKCRIHGVNFYELRGA